MEKSNRHILKQIANYREQSWEGVRPAVQDALTEIDRLTAELAEARAKEAEYRDRVARIGQKCDSLRGSMIYQRNRAERAETENNRLRKAIIVAQVGSCNCLTKTPESQYHHESCKYRILCEALEVQDDF